MGNGNRPTADPHHVHCSLPHPPMAETDFSLYAAQALRQYCDIRVRPRGGAGEENPCSSGLRRRRFADMTPRDGKRVSTSRQRTQLINALRAHPAKLGLVAAKLREGLHQLVTVVTECGDERLPSNARFACQAIVAQLHAVQTEINRCDNASPRPRAALSTMRSDWDEGRTAPPTGPVFDRS